MDTEDNGFAVWERPAPQVRQLETALGTYLRGRDLNLNIDLVMDVFASAARSGYAVCLYPGGPGWETLARLHDVDGESLAVLATARRTYLRRGQVFQITKQTHPDKWELRVVAEPGATEWTDLDEAVATFVTRTFNEFGYNLSRDEVEAMMFALADSSDGTLALADPDSMAWVAWMALRGDDEPAVQIRRALQTYTPGGRDILVKAKLYIY